MKEQIVQILKDSEDDFQKARFTENGNINLVYEKIAEKIEKAYRQNNKEDLAQADAAIRSDWINP